MKSNCINCGELNPKHGMKTCSRKCADEQKTKNNSWTRDCLNCKVYFTTRNSNKKVLCSEACRKQWVSLPKNIDNRINCAKTAIKEKFGVDNVFQLDEIKQKSKKSKLEKYGDENYNNCQKMLVTKEEKYGKNYFEDFNNRISKVLFQQFGVTHGLQLDKFKDKQKATVQSKYGVDNVSQNEKIKNKRKATIQDRYGVDYASQSEEIKKKIKETSFKNFGVDHHLKDYNRLQKHLMLSYKVYKYKDTNLTYQGSYEFHFLEQLDKRGLLSEVSNGSSFDYEFLGKKHVYHTDFVLRNEHIEIKSGWTYDGNGTNELLKELNHTKWGSVVAMGEKIIVLKSKQEISVFVNYL